MSSYLMTKRHHNSLCCLGLLSLDLPRDEMSHYRIKEQAAHCPFHDENANY